MSGDQRQMVEQLRRWGSQPTPVVEDPPPAQRAAHGRGTISAAMRRARAEAVRRGRWSTFGAWSAVAVVLLALWLGGVLDKPAPAVTVHDVGEGARVWRSGSSLHLDDQVQVREGDQVEAGSREGLVLRMTDVTEARLRPRTRLSLDRLLDAEQVLSLHRGEAFRCRNPTRQARVVVKTEVAEVMVLGTAFRVTAGDASGGPWTTVTVARGKVAVRHDGQRFTLTAGASWSSASRPAASQPAASRPATSQPAAEHLSSREDVPPRALAEASSPRAKSEPARSVRERAPRALAPAPAPVTLAAENRLFRSAIAARNRGDDATYVDLLDQFLAEYPRSPLRQEAAVERFRALGRLGRDAEAARMARRYLAEHEAGAARDEAREVVLGSERHESKVDPPER